MVKQKIVIRVSMKDAKKRTRALSTAVKLPGIISVEIEDDKITVIGDGVDSVALTEMLRKQMGFADLIRVATFEDRKLEKEENNTSYMHSPYPYQIHQYPCYNQSYYIK